MEKKYRISKSKENTIEFNGRTLHRIVALKDFGIVRKGDFGGYVESEKLALWIRRRYAILPL